MSTKLWLAIGATAAVVCVIALSANQRRHPAGVEVLYRGEYEYYSSGGFMRKIPLANSTHPIPSSRSIGAVLISSDADNIHQILAWSVGLEDLEVLLLGWTQVTDELMSYVARVKGLRFVSISQTQVGNEGLMRLVESESIEIIYAGGSRVTDEGRTQFLAVRPDVAVIRHR